MNVFKLFKSFTARRPRRQSQVVTGGSVGIQSHGTIYIVDAPPTPVADAEAPAPAPFDFNQAVEEARATLAASPNLSPKARQMLCDMTWTPSHERVTSVCQG